MSLPDGVPPAFPFTTGLFAKRQPGRQHRNWARRPPRRLPNPLSPGALGHSDRAGYGGSRRPKSGIFVLAAVGVWSPSRPSTRPASRDCGPIPANRLRQLMISTLRFANPPHCPRQCPRPMSHRRTAPSANRKLFSADFPPAKNARSLTTTPTFPIPAHGDQKPTLRLITQALVPVSKPKRSGHTTGR